jgi:hypothetical protein
MSNAPDIAFTHYPKSTKAHQSVLAVSPTDSSSMASNIRETCPSMRGILAISCEHW